MSNYFDHILLFNSKQQALEALYSLNLAESNEFKCNVIEPLLVEVPTGNFYPQMEGRDTIDEIKYRIPGYFMCIALHEPNEDLKNLPNGACRVVSDREAMDHGENHLVYLAPDLDPNLLIVADVSPVFAGAKYPF